MVARKQQMTYGDIPDTKHLKVEESQLMSQKLTIIAIDQLLPQTQCELCEYKGCLPYATAIVINNERIDRCLPGGVETLEALGQLLGVDTRPMQAEMTQKAKAPSVAVIIEDQCIGCTKCIQACPVDAILGASKQMHTVITDRCTGCELCIPPCPVDCIDMQAIATPSAELKKIKADQARERFNFRNNRLKNNKKLKEDKYQQATQIDLKLALKAALTRTQARMKNETNSSQ